MNLINMKKTYVLLVFFIAASVIIYLSNQNSGHSDKIHAVNENTPENIPRASNYPIQHNEAAVSVKNESVNEIANELIWKPGDPVLMAQLKEWRETRGWFEVMGGEVVDDYKSYSREALLQLADGGDIRALQLLALRASATEYKSLLSKAAAHGSIFALTMLANSTQIHSGITSNSPESDKKYIASEAAAYAEVAKMRGDLITDDNNIEYLENLYNIKITEKDREIIIARAKEIYAELEAKRIDLGLGKFDNSIPPVVQAYYQAMGVLP